MAPDNRRLVETIARGLENLPGISDCTVCINDNPQVTHLPDNDICYQFDLKTHRHHYGSLTLHLHDATALASYLPFINNTANLMALYLEIKDEQERFSLRWTESGGPAVSAPEYQGFGTKMIKGAIAYELNGDVEFKYDPKGFRCAITIPIDRGQT